MPEPYGPPPAGRAHALQAAEDALLDFDPEPVTRAIEALYDPALGLDASICKRAVIERLRREADEWDERIGEHIRKVADVLGQEWSNGR